MREQGLDIAEQNRLQKLLQLDLSRLVAVQECDGLEPAAPEPCPLPEPPDDAPVASDEGSDPCPYFIAVVGGRKLRRLSPSRRLWDCGDDSSTIAGKTQCMISLASTAGERAPNLVTHLLRQTTTTPPGPRRNCGCATNRACVGDGARQALLLCLAS